MNRDLCLKNRQSTDFILVCRRILQLQERKKKDGREDGLLVFYGFQGQKRVGRWYTRTRSKHGPVFFIKIRR